MADVFPKEKRSEIMAAVRSTGNKLTETKLVSIFRRYRVTGWRRHLRLLGRPDFTFRSERVVVFVDGCFWHGCPKHLRMPTSNRAYWQKKIAANMARDRTNTNQLRIAGWKVIRVWEHELGSELRVLRRLTKVLSRGDQLEYGDQTQKDLR
jgi:DNA mismatch endonuclease (patch repair protein)